MATHLSGPLIVPNGFQGPLTGDVIQAVGGNVAGDGAVAPAAGVATLSKATAATLTLAAPGAGNVGKRLLIISKTAAAHVITITGLDSTENTLTFGGAIGDSIELYAQTATLWTIISLNAVTPSTV